MRGSCHYKATGQCGLWAAGLMPESSSSLQMTVFPPQSRKNRGGRLWSSGGSGIMTGCILPTSTTATTSDILLRQAGKEPQDKHPTSSSAHLPALGNTFVSPSMPQMAQVSASFVVIFWACPSLRCLLSTKLTVSTGLAIVPKAEFLSHRQYLCQLKENNMGTCLLPAYQ